jgi:hypothetical protein
VKLRLVTFEVFHPEMFPFQLVATLKSQERLVTVEGNCALMLKDAGADSKALVRLVSPKLPKLTSSFR